MCLGIPGKVVQIIDAQNHIGQVDVSGVKRDVNLSCVMNENQAIEDLIDKWVLIHVGFAMSLLDESEAKHTLDVLAQMGELEVEQQEMQRDIES